MTFAVIKTGGKQYKVAANDLIKIEKLEASAGDIVTFDQVLMVGDTIGLPLVEGALVAGELVETRKSKTVIIFKKRAAATDSRRRNGHRQLLSTVRITEILTGGAQPTARAAAATDTTPSVTEQAAPKKASKATEAEATTAEAPAKKASAKKAAAATEDTAAEKPAKKAAAKKTAPKADQE
ncbi:50S ribosomal protein L21 [Devosia aurantiaca]|uniref:Large ribosomal subunit protein bL21 n=1 Tax=Devosia aurantiaca TaxID=2714858 RepID=A0A6M1SHA0_9HYPH|nr:50S ribosomal protein L21 [Devosia aurantiaca]NGP16550.1 50S ribosomal protein L21 [Devosia aurantiaca]